MFKLMFAVFDSKAEAFGMPIFVDTIGVAVRSFTASVGDERSELHRFAEDFTLFELGRFNPKDGTFELVTPRSIVRAAVILEQLKSGKEGR